ncbi:alpha/beta hydrolase [Salibacterium aidingense]|uniref:alpha/beta hydrolase n=1 Tax=Salibacterium aidingense TaxID=384933 RepID=UPI003BEA2FBB
MNGTMRALPFRSELLDYTFDLHIYLPPNYSRLYTYHLAIAQDGRDYFQLGKIGRKVEGAIEAGAEDTIVIGVPYPSIGQRREWYHPESRGHYDYMSFLAKELLPFLESEFPTPRLSYGRTLMGDSLAGTISLLTALRYPHTFARIMIHSPFVNDTVLQAVQTSKEWHPFDIYHAIGLDETKVHTTDGSIQDFLTPNRKLHHLLQQGTGRRYYHEFNGGHLWSFWEKDLPRALQYMLNTQQER